MLKDARIENGYLICDKCNLKMRPITANEFFKTDKYSSDVLFQTTTLLGYWSPKNHDHDDNCVIRIYICDNCLQQKRISVQKKCPACEWIGRDSYFCHDGHKLKEWPK